MTTIDRAVKKSVAEDLPDSGQNQASRLATSIVKRGVLPLNVLVLLNAYEIGGTQLNAVDLAQSLRSRGINSHLFAYREGARTEGMLREYALERGETIHSLDRPEKGVESTRQIARAARDCSADLVHAFGYSDLIHYAYWGACFGGRRPLILTIYEMMVPESTPRHQPMIVGTGYLVDDEAHRPVAVKLISPPVDTGRDDVRQVDSGRFLMENGLREAMVRVVIVSRLDEVMKAKAIEDSIRAVGQLASTLPVQLIVVGGGDAEARLKLIAAQINRAHDRPRIIFTGPMSDPRPAYACADIVIGMGGSAARALSFGRPLVVSGEDGWYQTFSPATAQGLFRNSFWSPDRLADPLGTLQACLRSLIHDPALRHDLGEFGREFALNNFSLTEMADRTYNLYQDVAAESGHGARWLRDLPLERAALGRGVRSVAR